MTDEERKYVEDLLDGNLPPLTEYDLEGGIFSEGWMFKEQAG